MADRQPETSRGSDGMNGWKLLTLAYACLYAVFVYWMYSDNIAVEYPVLYVAWSALVQILVVTGLLAYALDRGHWIASVWWWLFPLMIVDVLASIYVDAVVPADFNLQKDGTAWIGNLLLNLWFAVPAYYLNFKVAYRRARS
jgi:hypothetical protein